MRHIAGCEEWGVRITRRPACRRRRRAGSGAPGVRRGVPRRAQGGARRRRDAARAPLARRPTRPSSACAGMRSDASSAASARGARQQSADSRSGVPRDRRAAARVQGRGDAAGRALCGRRRRDDADRPWPAYNFVAPGDRVVKRPTAAHGRVRRRRAGRPRSTAPAVATRPSRRRRSEDAAASARARADAEAALRAPKRAVAQAPGRAHHRRRRVDAARSDRQPAEQGRHAERGPDPGAGGRRPRLHPAVGAAVRRRSRAARRRAQPARRDGVVRVRAGRRHAVPDARARV